MHTDYDDDRAFNLKSSYDLICSRIFWLSSNVLYHSRAHLSLGCDFSIELRTKIEAKNRSCSKLPPDELF